MIMDTLYNGHTHSIMDILYNGYHWDQPPSNSLSVLAYTVLDNKAVPYSEVSIRGIGGLGVLPLDSAL